MVLPIGVPGMGKSHYADNVLSALFEQNFPSQRENLIVIKNDQIREGCIDDWRR